MASGRGRLEWSQTAELLAVLYETNRDSKKRSRPFTADEFNPYSQRGKVPMQEASTDISMCKEAVLSGVGRRRR